MATTPLVTPLLKIDNVSRSYSLPRDKIFQKPAQVHALQGVSLSIYAGQSFGLVGESGSGKSTLARLCMALEKPDSGAVKLLGQDLNQLGKNELRSARRDFQMVFQDPYGSLDPRQTVERIVTEPLRALNSLEAGNRGAILQKQATAVLDSVGLRSSDLGKYPHEFSGGQRQRIAIARALITRPKLIVADEPVSALDVSVQAQVLNLMQDLQQELGVTYLLISHDLAVVNHLCAQIGVIYQGRIVEQGTPEALFQNAKHPYTQALLAAVPRMVPTLGRRASYQDTDKLSGPNPAAACPYAPRCPKTTAACLATRPDLTAAVNGHRVACHHP